MNLGKLIDKLTELPQDGIVAKGFGEPHSYRGYYEQLGFTPVENVSVKAMITYARSARGKTFEGYKGGSYTMTTLTDCWIAEYGETAEDPITDAQIELWRIECKTGSKTTQVDTDELRELASGLQTDGDDREPQVMRTAADEIDQLRGHLQHVIDRADTLDAAINSISRECKAHTIPGADIWISPVEQGRKYLAGAR